MMVDKDKEYTTQDGHEVRIYATDGSPPYQVHGAVRFDGIGWIAQTWRENGRILASEDTSQDLTEKTKKIVRYIHINKDGSTTTLKKPVVGLVGNYLAIKRIEIEYKEGEYDA